MLDEKHMRLLVMCFCLLGATACDQSLTSPSTPLNTEFVLAPGESMAIEAASLTLTFNRVSGDSRCPADAFCIQGGSADVHVTATSGRVVREHVLKTGDMKPVQDGDATIALVQLSPYPFSSRTIAPHEYRATLKVTR
jgi:hypothetical protein